MAPKSERPGSSNVGSQRVNDERRWLSDFVGFFIGLNFFRDLGQTAEAVADHLEREYRDEWGMPIDPQFHDVELLLLQYDRKRTYYDTWEADVGPGNAVYASLLRKIGELSSGTLRIENIEEIWPDDGRGARVAFIANGRRIELEMMAPDDRIDLKFFGAIRELVGGMSAIRPFITVSGDFFELVMMTDGEKETIESARGWRFDG